MTHNWFTRRKCWVNSSKTILLELNPVKEKVPWQICSTTSQWRMILRKRLLPNSDLTDCCLDYEVYQLSMITLSTEYYYHNEHMNNLEKIRQTFSQRGFPPSVAIRRHELERVLNSLVVFNPNPDRWCIPFWDNNLNLGTSFIRKHPKWGVGGVPNNNLSSKYNPR